MIRRLPYNKSNLLFLFIFEREKKLMTLEETVTLIVMILLCIANWFSGYGAGAGKKKPKLVGLTFSVLAFIVIAAHVFLT